MVDPDYTATVGLDRDQARALVADAEALRTAVAVRLLLHNALRVDEACTAEVAALGEDSGHRVLRVVHKGLGDLDVAAAEVTNSARAHTYRQVTKRRSYLAF